MMNHNWATQTHYFSGSYIAPTITNNDAWDRSDNDRRFERGDVVVRDNSIEKIAIVLDCQPMRHYLTGSTIKRMHVRTLRAGSVQRWDLTAHYRLFDEHKDSCQ